VLGYHVDPLSWTEVEMISYRCHTLTTNLQAPIKH
jgi:hypothetical protein